MIKIRFFLRSETHVSQLTLLVQGAEKPSLPIMCFLCLYIYILFYV